MERSIYNQFDVKQVLNGDQVVGFGSTKDLAPIDGFMDYAKSHSFAAYQNHDGGDFLKKKLGLIELFANQRQESVPFMKDLFEKAAVLEVEEGQRVQYELPVNNAEAICYTKEDTSTVNGTNPGIDESLFTLILNKPYAKNDILTYDLKRGVQAMVSPAHDVEQVGENYRHYMQMSLNSKVASFPTQYLKAGIQYYKVGSVTGELEEDLSSVQIDKSTVSYITNEFVLGDPQGVSIHYTKKASNMRVPGLNTLTNEMTDKVLRDLDAMGGKNKDFFFIATKMMREDGKGGLGNFKMGYTLEYLVTLEMQKMEASKLLFADAAVFRTGNTTKMVNEGAWKQIQRGKVINYPRNIEMTHLAEAVNYVHRGNYDSNPELRVTRFKGGWMAYNRVLQIIKDEAINQANHIPHIMPGQTTQTKDTLFSGDLANLSMNLVRITSATIPGLGKIEVEHDPSLDYNPFADRRSVGLNGQGYADTTWSLTIWDAAEQSAVGYEPNKQRGLELPKYANAKNNMFYIKPTSGSYVMGFEQGRMPLYDQVERVQSSMKTMAREIWALNQSACLILDLTRYVTIQKQPERIQA